MGIIQRQSIKDSIVTYVGVALGAVNTLFIYTLIPKEEIGLIEFLISWTMLLSPIIMFGSTNLAVRFFPVFQDAQKGHNGFLFLLLLLPSVGLSLFALVVWLFKEDVLAHLSTKDPIIRQYLVFVLPLTLFFSFSTLFIHYIKNFYKIVIPTLLENVFVKVARGGLTLLYFFAFLSFSGLLIGIVGAYGLVLLGLILYTYYLEQLHLKPDFSSLRKPLVLDMGVFALYGILGSISGNLMQYIDKAMIPLLMSEQGSEANGIFAILGYIGTAIDIPRRSLEKIMAPVVSSSIQNNDWENIKKLYWKSSINQLIAGCLLFLGIWLNLDSFFDIMPNGDSYRPWRIIVLTLGMSAIVDMATGINSHIIAYSKYFRFNFYLVLILSLLNVMFNYLFIKTFELNIFGAALATLTSITVFNLIKYIFIYIRFGIQPFTWHTLWVILLSLGIYFVVSFVPDLGNPFLDIAVRSTLIAALFLSPVLYFRFSPDLNNLWAAAFDRAKKWLKI